MRALPIFIAAILITSARISVAQIGFEYYGAATEGRANSFSQVVQAVGSARLASSQAAINYEEARSMNFDNRLKWTETYYEMRRMNRAYRAERTPKRSREFWFNLAKVGAPKRLTPSQLDPVTGEITWPTILKLPTYAEYRNKLDDLFASRASAGGGIGEHGYEEIQQTVDAMGDELKKHIREHPSMDYVTSSSFLKSLAYEAKFPLGVLVSER